MALITRCPGCGTLFKVVPDQLRISEGWVRCGQCAEVFEASGDLQQSDAVHHAVQPLVHFPDLPPEPSPAVSVLEWKPELLEAPPVEPPSETVGLPEPVKVTPEPEVLEPAAERMESPATLASPLAEDVPGSPSALEPELLSNAAATAYSFVREPASQARVRRPVLRGLWVASAALLVAALVLQGVVHGRDRIAAVWPETKPLLQAACVSLGCTVQALRKIDAIVIDSSTLSALRNEDAYRLNMVLKNQAKLDLAVPAIEFVLTDIDEQAVFRRVLTPAELGAVSRVLFAGREWVSSVDLRVLDNPNKGRIVGYRLLAFYP